MQVTLLEHMGSDLSVVNAARVSFDKESNWEVTGYREEVDLDGQSVTEWPIYKLTDKDAKLIRYLAKHNHWTPFGHCFASFRIKAPLFCARQLGKHQVGLVWNEISRRYVDSEPEFYVPDAWRKRAENVKQGSSDETIDLRKFGPNGDDFHLKWDADLEECHGYHVNDCLKHYEALLRAGVCPEQARMVLPQSMYTEWVWSGSLAAFARVCKLRLDPHTQKETRDVAEMIDAEMRRLFPVSWEALMET